ncbi:MAG: pilus assembly protein [Bifidobacterium sp.]|jgi:Flp pilus assembly protein TadG|nr:pilus assembly protein [Bifidobacterium sp.]MCH4174812.1 pilus assembly protein [Bifidobacterium sp.]
MRNSFAGQKSISDTGTVTAEFAMILPAVMTLVVLLLALVSAVTAHLDCQDAASAAIRQLVISQDVQQARDAALLAAGKDTIMKIQHSGKQVVITTTCPIVPDTEGWLPLSVNGRAAGLIDD